MPTIRIPRLLFLAAALSIVGSLSAQESPTTDQPMAAEADPAFEVATIKPSKSTALTLQMLTQRGHYFETSNSSLLDFTKFAYDLNEKQILNAPDWMDKARYDITAVPNQDGVPKRSSGPAHAAEAPAGSLQAHLPPRTTRAAGVRPIAWQ